MPFSSLSRNTVIILQVNSDAFHLSEQRCRYRSANEQRHLPALRAETSLMLSRDGNPLVDVHGDLEVLAEPMDG